MADLDRDLVLYTACPLLKGEDRHEMFTRCFKSCLPEGLVLEFGVYDGGSIGMIHDIFKTTVYGFDSWQGLPNDDGHFRKGTFSTNGKTPNIGDRDIRFVSGWFEHTLPKFLEVTPGNIRFVHIDCDVYSSTKTVFDNIKTRLVSGSIICFDEFKFYPGWEVREFKAFHELIDETGFDYDYICRTGEDRAAVILKG